MTFQFSIKQVLVTISLFTVVIAAFAKGAENGLLVAHILLGAIISLINDSMLKALLVFLSFSVVSAVIFSESPAEYADLGLATFVVTFAAYGVCCFMKFVRQTLRNRR